MFNKKNSKRSKQIFALAMVIILVAVSLLGAVSALF